MKRNLFVKKLRAVLFIIIIFAGIGALDVFAETPVCRIGATYYTELGEALASVDEDSPATIILLADIEYNEGIVVSGKKITFETNGYTLNIINEAGTALEVSNNGWVNFDWGPDENGELNAISNSGGHAVYVHSGGMAFVKNAAATAKGIGDSGGVAVYAQDNGSNVKVYGDVTSTNPNALICGAAVANDGAAVEIEGNVICTVNLTGIEELFGVAALSGGSSVIVLGSIEVDGSNSGSINGVLAMTGSTVIIDGSVTVSGAGEITGVSSMGGTAIIEGDITADGTGEITGVWSALGGTTVINGIINVTGKAKNIALGNEKVTDVDGMPGKFPDSLIVLLDNFGRSDMTYNTYQVYTYTEVIGSSNYENFVYQKTSSGSACAIGDTEYSTLEEALDAAVSAVTTIKLLREIVYSACIEVNGKTVIFDLNGYTLNVINTAGNALSVGAGGVVDITDTSGAESSSFNVMSSNGYGIYILDGGQAALTMAYGNQGGVYAAGGSSVSLKGMVIGSDACVVATGGSTVTVDGEIMNMGDGNYIVLGDIAKNKTDGMIGTYPYESYLIYSDAVGNIVRAKTNAVCKLSIIKDPTSDISFHDTIDSALEEVNNMPEGSEATIELIKDIDYYTGFKIEERTLNFDLNGHTFNVICSIENVLEIGSGGTLTLIEEGGKFNVINNAEFAAGNGVYVHDGGKAEITNASSSSGSAIYAENGGEVIISGNAEGFIGTIATGDDNYIEISGNIISMNKAVGVEGERNVVIVRGNVSLSGAEQPNTIGVTIISGTDSVVLIDGDLNVTGTNAKGVSLEFGGSVIIQGELNAPEEAYIELISLDGSTTETASLTADDGVPGVLPEVLLDLLELDDGSYLIYNDEINFVYIKDSSVSAVISPASGSFDKYNPADVATAITWNDAASVTDIKTAGASIGAENYSVSGNTLTIKKEYLAAQALGDLVLTVGFNIGEPAVLTVTVSDTTPVSAVISPAEAVFDLDAPEDIVTLIIWNDAVTVTGVFYGSESLKSPADFTVNENILTIREEFFSGLNLADGDTVELAISFDAGENVVLTIEAEQSYVPGTDAALSELTVGSIAVTGFAADIYNYTVELPYGTSPGSAAATVSAAANDPKAAVIITQAPVLPGVATVIVTAEDKIITKTYTVDLIIGAEPVIPVTNITVAGMGGAESVQAGSSLQMLADVSPANASDKSVIWSISGGSGAYISASGLLTATASGSVTVRADANDGSGVYGEKIITITAAPVTTYIITASAGSGGIISPGGAVYVTEGSSKTFIIIPDPGYRINQVTVDGINHGAQTAYTFEDVTANHTINASFIRTYYGGIPFIPYAPLIPSAPQYKAEIKANGTVTTLPVSIDIKTGTASVDAGSRSLDKNGTVITIPSISDADTYTVGIPVSVLSTDNLRGTLTIETDIGSVTLPSDMLTGVTDTRGNKAEITVGKADKENIPDEVRTAVGDRPVIRLTLSVDGRQTDWNNPDAPVTVSIPYDPTVEELADPESIVVWYIDGSGNAVTVANGRYDPGTGTVTFTVTHFSDYATVYNKVSFGDAAADTWYSKAVNFIAARGITNDICNGSYSPEAKLTRGEFIVMMMRAYEISPDMNPTDNFSDAGNTYYTGYLATAKRLGISAGTGSNQYAPDKEITRQEMFTMLYKALTVIGQLPEGDSGKKLSDFDDAGQIDTWAKKAITLLVKTGIIGGSNGKLMPRSTVTRAEIAQVLYNLLGM